MFSMQGEEFISPKLSFPIFSPSRADNKDDFPDPTTPLTLYFSSEITQISELNSCDIKSCHSKELLACGGTQCGKKVCFDHRKGFKL